MTATGTIRVRRTSPLAGAAVLLTLATLSWGTFAFGGVYPWAYRVVIIASAIAGLLAVASSAGLQRIALTPAVPVALFAIIAATLLQLVPLPTSILSLISPSAPETLRQIDLAFATAERSGSATHPLTISPQATLLGLAFLASFSCLLIGLSALLSTLSRRSLLTIVEAILCLGVLLALVGIAQKATFNGRIYGYWPPRFSGQPFGPFMNRNHFAGWMLMAIPLGAAYFFALLDRAMQGTGPQWRHRVLWFSTNDANRLVLVGLSVLIMTLGLAMTFSRSGISAFAVQLLVFGALLVRRNRRTTKRDLAVGYLVLLVVCGATWAGVDALVERFGLIPGSELGGRLGPWSDTLGVIRRFPLSGTGLNTFGTSMLLYQRHDPQAHYREAHNDYLQLAAEGGLLLGIPIVIAILVLVREAMRRLQTPSSEPMRLAIRTGAVIGLASVAIQELSDFSLQMPADATFFAILCALAIHQEPVAEKRVPQ